MTSPSGRFVTVYNGEIYNHLELRERLSGPWRGHSDTETLLAAIEAWGVEEALKQCAGMFALALWDRAGEGADPRPRPARREAALLRLARRGRRVAFLFGSELKALARHPAFRREIDRQALALFTRFNYVPAPHSIYAGIVKLPPGTFLTLRAGERGARDHDLTGRPPRSPRRAPRRRSTSGRRRRPTRSSGCSRKAVSQQMISDVPLGAFLSGGVDSSTVVALMQAQSSRPVKSFSIGFSDPAYDEAEHAGGRRPPSRHRPHRALRPARGRAGGRSRRCPPSTTSPSPTPRRSRPCSSRGSPGARSRSRLSGDGGDELFAGYNRYRLAARNWGRISQGAAAAPQRGRPGSRRASRPSSGTRSRAPSPRSCRRRSGSGSRARRCTRPPGASPAAPPTNSTRGSCRAGATRPELVIGGGEPADPRRRRPWPGSTDSAPASG